MPEYLKNKKREKFLKITAIVFAVTFVLQILFSLTFKLFINVGGSVLYNNIFSDFAEVLLYCLVKNPYDNSAGFVATYPPISYLPFYLFALMAKESLMPYLNGEVEKQTFLGSIFKDPVFVIALSLYYLINITLIVISVIKISGFKGKERIYIGIIAACNGAMAFAFIRGNVIVTTALFCLLFLAFYESESRLFKELSLVCLGIASAMKIYPAAFAILLIRDKRIVDVVKAALYTLILYFVPFFIFGNGMEDIKCVIANMTGFGYINDRGKMLTNISLHALISKTFKVIEVITDWNLSSITSVVSWIVRICSLACLIAVTIKNMRQNEIFYLLVCAAAYVILFPNVSYGYSVVYMMFAAIYFIKNNNKFSLLQIKVYGITFGVLFSPAIFSIPLFIVQNIAVIFLFVFSLLNCFGIFTGDKSKKKIKDLEKERD